MYYENFENLCKINNVKPNQVSKATGIHTATLTSWKQGKYTPKPEKLQLIADYFNVSVDYLLGSENYEYDKNDSVWNYHVSKHDKILIEKVMLDSDLSKRLIAYAEKLAEILDEEEIEINRKKGD